MAGTAPREGASVGFATGSGVAEPTPDASARRSGVEHAYEELVRAVYAFIYARVGNREEAEDLTSQVFVKALHGLDATRRPEEARAWVFRTARTTLADHWRAVYRLPTQSLDVLLDAGWDGPHDEAAPAAVAPRRAADPATRVARLLGLLPERYRAVLTYRFLQNRSVRETAAIMQLSEANVKVLQLRALRRAAEMQTGDDAPDDRSS